VLLSACETDLAAQDYDEALTLATAFLAVGAVSVIGSRWSVDDAGTAVFMFMFHFFFDHGRRSPGAALRSTQLWMLDPGRSIPDVMPESLRGLCADLDLTAVSLWGAFSHHGW
jgi:CHAT domain-containing protein